MNFEFWPAVVAGLVGAVVMTMMMTAMRRANKTRMDMALMQGAMVTADPGRARAVGLFTHLVVMGAVVFGSIYALVFQVLDVAAGAAWWVGTLIGLVHGVILGLVMAAMPAMHLR